MSNDEITYKDLNKIQLDKLKDIYISSRIEQMPEIELRIFVKSVITDQIKGTVGNEEEREAWNEMRDHFDNDFPEKIKQVISDKDLDLQPMASPEQLELEKRIKLLEERNKQKDEKSMDMW